MARVHQKRNKPRNKNNSQPHIAARRSRPELWYKVIIILTIATIIGAIYTLYQKEIYKLLSTATSAIEKFKPTVQEIIISGNDRLSYNQVLELTNLQLGNSLLELNLAKIKNDLQKSGWIKHADVKRFLTGKVQIIIKERVPQVLWILDNKLFLLDYQGEVVEKLSGNANMTGMLKVKGEGANQGFGYVLEAFANIGIAEQVVVLTKINNRRWNVLLDNGIEIKLPEDNLPEALNKLPLIIKLHKEDNLLSYIDLRGAPTKIYIKYAENN